MKFEDMAKHEEIAWRQRSRALWLRREIGTQVFSIELQTNIEESTPLINLKSMELRLPNQKKLRKKLLNTMRDYIHNQESGDYS